MILFWKREKPLAKALEFLERALAKVKISKNIVESSKGKVDKMLILSAFSGFPVSSRAMASVYFSSALGDVKKAIKILNKTSKSMYDSGISEIVSSLKSLEKEENAEAFERKLEAIINKLRFFVRV